MNLYELSEWQRELTARLDANEEDGTIPLPTAAEIDRLCAQMSSKVEGVCRVLRNMQAEAAALRAEEDRLNVRRLAAEARAKWLKDYLYACLDNAGETRYVAGIFKLRIQRNSQPSTNVDVDARKLPAEYQVTNIVTNKDKLLEDFKANKPLPPGVTIVYGSHVRIT